jgi:outer membrane receptor protein involved in Fe transport
MRLSVIGLSNNINQQNFAMQDLLGVTGGGGQRPGLFGGGGRRGGGAFSGPTGGGGGGQFSGGNLNISNFLVGQQNGVTSTHSVGANFSDTWWDDVQVNQSYFFNVASNGNNQTLRREYLASPDSTMLYNESTNSESKNFNHRVDTRLQWTIDSSNSVIFQPQAYVQENRAASSQLGANTGANASLLSQAFSNNRSNTDGFNLSGRLVYRHKFDAPGRTISIDLIGGRNRKNGAGEQQSVAAYFTSAANPSDTVDQQSSLLTQGRSLATRLVYTEPLSEFNQLQLSYSPSWSKNTSDNRKFAFNPLTQAYDRQVPSLSNAYENTYLTHRVSLGYRWRNADYTATLDVGIQQATLRGMQTYPFVASVERKFLDILPSASLNYKFSEQTNLRANYRSSTREPSISQLQNAVDISNPLFVSTGNPDLKQSVTHSLSARIGAANPREARTLFAVLSASYTLDYIANATLTAARDTIVHRDIRLTQGTQLTYPTNLDGYWSLRAFFTYGLPVDLVGSNVNLNAGFSYSRIPGLINTWRNITHNSGLSAGAVISSNISEDIDFTISYNGTYNIARNTLQAEQNSNYYNHSANAKASIIFGDGFVFRNETGHILYTGLSANFDRSYWLWNVSLAKKLFDNQRGELRLGVTDLLDQNKSLNRSVTETYIEDTENRILGRFLMATFTYTVR